MLAAQLDRRDQDRVKDAGAGLPVVMSVEALDFRTEGCKAETARFGV